MQASPARCTHSDQQRSPACPGTSSRDWGSPSDATLAARTGSAWGSPTRVRMTEGMGAPLRPAAATRAAPRQPMRPAEGRADIGPIPLQARRIAATSPGGADGPGDDGSGERPGRGDRKGGPWVAPSAGRRPPPAGSAPRPAAEDHGCWWQRCATPPGHAGDHRGRVDGPTPWSTTSRPACGCAWKAPGKVRPSASVSSRWRSPPTPATTSARRAPLGLGAGWVEAWFEGTAPDADAEALTIRHRSDRAPVGPAAPWTAPGRPFRRGSRPRPRQRRLDVAVRSGRRRGGPLDLGPALPLSRRPRPTRPQDGPAASTAGPSASTPGARP